MIVDLKRIDIGKRLARKNISQNSLAQKLGISSGYMSQLMCGVRHPSPQLRQLFLDYFGCEFDDIFILKDAICGRSSRRIER
jgi:transcriptional regulator with XRE-family HTH domain